MEEMRGTLILSLAVIVHVLFLTDLIRPGEADAQSVLERISVTERSDGLGFVIRLHMTEAPDSFRVAQPKVNTIQAVIYDSEFRYLGYRPPESSNVIEHIKVLKMDSMKGIGFEFTLQDSLSAVASSYPDVNQNDILIALEYADDLSVNSDWLFEHQTEDNLHEYRSVEEEREPVSVSTETEYEEMPEDKQKGNRWHLQRLDRIVPDDPVELYARAFMQDEISASYLLRPGYSSINSQNTDAVHPWKSRFPFMEFNRKVSSDDLVWSIYSPRVFLSNNTELPSGYNDGALWQGVGRNMMVTGGAGATYGPITAVFKPVFTYSENLDFELSPFPPLEGLSDYARALMNTDMPQRFGEESLSDFHLGDSFIQFDYKGFAAGLSNQRMWTGPAVYNPLIFSYNAPGFLHGYVGTGKPYNFRYGSLEAKWFWGGLRESEYFDEDPSNDLRYLSGVILNYSPQFVPGLHVGITRTAYSYYPENGLGLSDIFLPFRLVQPDHVTEPGDVFRTMTSFYGRWVFPKAGFEVYGEWGRNDNRRELRDIIAEPELNRGYVFGIIKSFNISNQRKLLLTTEFTNIENSTVTSQYRDFNTWYEHDVIRQGFTHRGQVLGASVGPGSSTQIMKLSYYEKRGMLGASVQRILMFNDRFHRHKETFRNLHPSPQYWFMIDRHMVQMKFGFHSLLFLPYKLELQIDYTISKIDNIYNQYMQDVINNQLQISLRYNFR